MMEDLPTFLGSHLRQYPFSSGLPLFHDVSVEDMARDAASNLKDDDGGVSLNRSFHVAGSKGSGSEKKAAVVARKGDYDQKKKKTRSQRFAFQTRSQVDILDDGYRWRKYGQKAVKNNKFPRSYYRCTFQGCRVKKQVQRLTRDEGVVVTTYEGVHSHPIEKSTDNFEHILSQMQIYTSY